VTGSTIVVAVKDQIFSEVAGEVVILHLQQGVYYGLNNVGARIWQLIQQPRTVDEVCDLIAQEFDAPKTQIERDVAALFDDLLSRGMVEIHHA
jgi:hypothetical protein